MKTILKTDSCTGGIFVTFLKGDLAESKIFSYENLIETKINAADLLNHPEYYGVTDDETTIKRTDFCKPELHEDSC